MRAGRLASQPMSVVAAAAAVIVAVVVGSAGCAGSATQPGTSASSSVAITDMLGRNVKIPRVVHRILALHPIPTTLLELLAPDRIVSVDTVFARSLERDDARFTRDQMSSLKSLPRTGVYFNGLDLEQVIGLHPDVVITMTGDTDIDREQDRTGIPFFAVSKVPTASYETTIRLIGQIVGDPGRAEQMAGFWARKVSAVQARAARIPVDRRPRVIYTGKNGDILGVPGRDTVFGSTIVAAGGSYVANAALAGHRSTENNPVSVEQILIWDPEVVIAASTAAKTRIVHDPRWRTVRAVRDGHLYVPPKYAGLDGLQAVLGLVWTQGVLFDDDDDQARAALASTMQGYYELFYGHPLTPGQIEQQAA